jgi:hypothetical protein
MNQSIVLGIGTGRCGLRSLAKLLNQQPETQSSYEEPPLLPWKPSDAERVIRERFARFRARGREQILCDVASFYLPYLDAAIAAEPSIRIICFRRPREEVVVSFCEWLDASFPLPTNHWTDRPALGWHHDPLRTPTYPQYDTQNREEAIRRYWDEYYRHVEELRTRHPDRIRIFDTYETLNAPGGMKDLLEFAGVPPDRQVASVGVHINDPPEASKRRWARRSSGSPMDPRRCVILVPFGFTIIPPCERALEELERRGYDVRRVGGYAAIDQGRNQMATDALIDGYEETMWIDSDVDFHPDSVDRLRSHGLPIVSGIYAQKGKRALASHVMPGTPKVVFGKDGGLIEILYAGAGFLHIRREVYLAIQKRQRLPMCNERFRSPMIPFFHSMVHPIEDGHWYLAEDYAFCQRARASGFKIMADTTIRLWHVGNHSFGWEDAGRTQDRFETFILNLGPEPESARQPSADWTSSMAAFASRYRWPDVKPRIPLISERNPISEGMQEVISRCVSHGTRLVANLGPGVGSSTRFIADLAPSASIIAIDTWDGNGKQQSGPALLLPFETFLSECWGYRDQIVPLKADWAEGLREIAQSGLKPELICVGQMQRADRFHEDLCSVINIFPGVTVVGDGWDQETVRKHVVLLARDKGIELETNGTCWRYR